METPEHFMTLKYFASAHCWLRAVCVALMFFASQVRAITPESGLYWSPANDGTGYSVDVQGSVVVLIVYTYAADGEPEVLTGSGTLGGAGGGFFLEAPYHFQFGVTPLNGISGTLYRPTNGREFLSTGPLPAGRVLQSTPVTTFGMTFLTQNAIFLTVAGDTRVIYRMNFAIGAFGSNAFPPYTCINDYRGEWVYIDQSAPARAPWRFNFTEVSVPADFGCQRPRSTLVFRDPSRNAEMRCSVGRLTEPLPPNFLVEGCEVFVDGQLQFSVFGEDLGLDRVIGYLGPLQTWESQIMRRAERVIGFRVR